MIFTSPFYLPDADYNDNNDVGDDDDDDDGTLGKGGSQTWVEPGPLSHSREKSHSLIKHAQIGLLED